ncbi:MAG: hypothetical protein ABEI98_08880 [Halorhabdus sp.]
MTAIDPKESARYAGRLFGYLLVVSVVGGGITAGGVVLLEDTTLFSSGSVDVGAEVIVGGTLTGVGGLVILAGLFAIVLNVIADGVRFGVGATPTVERESIGQPASRWSPSQPRRIATRAPPSRPNTSSRESDREQTSQRTRERTDTRHGETWKREVEEKLSAEERRDRSPSDQSSDVDQSGRATAPPSDTGATGQQDDVQTTTTDTAAGTGAEPTADETRSHIEREASGVGDTSPTREPPSAEESGSTDSETWVSGDEVNDPSESGADDRETVGASSGERAATRETDDADRETTDADRSEVSDAPDDESTLDTDAASGSDAGTPAWLEETDNDESS